MSRILLMDQMHEETLRHALTASGHAIAGETASAHDLPGQAAALHPDAVIVNTASPDHVVLEQLNWLQQHHPCPVVVFSGDGSDEKIHDVVRVGVTSYVVNGFSAWRLNAILNTAIARFNETRELRLELAAMRRQLTAPERLRDKCAHQLLHTLAAERERIHDVGEQSFVTGTIIGFMLGMVSIGVWNFAPL
ncbi:MAG: hypothetical protein AB1513_06200 [Pseudomonadota bacterium]